jgi:4a-hydroxytetrahydrobiopterin dehydratase
VFENFVQAMSFIVQVGFLAEKQGHHPEILMYIIGKFKIVYMMQMVLTKKDFDLASAIEKLG